MTVEYLNIRRLVCDAVPYMSKYPDRLKVSIINDNKIRIVQYTAIDQSLIDDAEESFKKHGTLHDDQNTGRIIEYLVHFGGIVVTGKVTKPCEKYNSSKIINIPFEEI